VHPGSPIDWAPQEAQREPKMCEISAEPRSKGPNALRQQPSADAPRRSTDRTRICARAHSWTIVPSRPAAALEFDPHLRRDCAGLGSPRGLVAQLYAPRDSSTAARRVQSTVSAGSVTPYPASAMPLPHLHCAWARTPATSAPGPGSPLPHAEVAGWASPATDVGGVSPLPRAVGLVYALAVVPRPQLPHTHACTH
jgi:hypothetical protein